MPRASASTSRATSTSSLYSAPSVAASSDLPRPTLGDIALPARRVDRDGSSTRRGSSVSSSISSGRGMRRSASRLPTSRSVTRTEPDERRPADEGTSHIEVMPCRRRPTSPGPTPPTYRSERTGDRRFRFRIDAQDEASGSQSEAAPGRGMRPTRRVRRKRPVIVDSEDDQDSNSAASTASFRLASSPSLTPPPPEDTPPPPPPPLDRDSSSIDAPQLPQAGLSIARDTSYNPPERNADGSRRYTAKEKGKGKAGAKTANPPGNVPDADVSGGEECIEVIDVTQDGRSRKRKREEKAKLAASEVVEVGSSQGSDRAQMEAGSYIEKATVLEKEPEVKDRRKVGVEEDKALASYSELELAGRLPASVANGSMPDLLLRTRPARHHSMVGYVHRDKPIGTNRSGHVTCAKCLLDALLAAIKRNPDPTPGRNHWNPRGRGRGANRSRGRGTHNPSHHSSRGPTHPLSYPMGGPAEWTTEALKAVWLESKEREYHRGLISHGMEEKNWAVSRELDEAAPREETTYVTEELKGLWALDGVAYVVEGECPVCRKPLPGGYGPPGSGIGGVLPLYPMLNKQR